MTNLSYVVLNSIQYYTVLMLTATLLLKGTDRPVLQLPNLTQVFSDSILGKNILSLYDIVQVYKKFSNFLNSRNEKIEQIGSEFSCNVLNFHSCNTKNYKRWGQKWRTIYIIVLHCATKLSDDNSSLQRKFKLPIRVCTFNKDLGRQLNTAAISHKITRSSLEFMLVHIQTDGTVQIMKYLLTWHISK